MLLSEDCFQAGKETASAQRRSHQVHLSEATWMTVHMYKLMNIIQAIKNGLAKTALEHQETVWKNLYKQFTTLFIS